jgi:4-aminobutyrate aminotransferase-like enzyme
MSIISNVLRLDLMLAFDLPDEKLRDFLVHRLYLKYLIVLKCGNKLARLRPFLYLKNKEINHFLEILKKELSSISKI